MQDDILELLEPTAAARYRRWRPLTTTIQIVAIALALVAEVIVLVYRDTTCGTTEMATMFFVASCFLWAAQFTIDRLLTRSVSLMGSKFSTPLRRYLAAGWAVVSITCVSVIFVIGDDPMGDPRSFNKVCNQMPFAQ